MFELTGLPPAPRGVPQIEVAFDIDANGIVHVRAKDLGTGKEQSMTITGGSALPKDDIERMMRDAEAARRGGQARREDAETRNLAESLQSTRPRSSSPRTATRSRPTRRRSWARRSPSCAPPSAAPTSPRSRPPRRRSPGSPRRSAGRSTPRRRPTAQRVPATAASTPARPVPGAAPEPRQRRRRRRRRDRRRGLRQEVTSRPPRVRRPGEPGRRARRRRSAAARRAGARRTDATSGAAPGPVGAPADQRPTGAARVQHSTAPEQGEQMSEQLQ